MTGFAETAVVGIGYLFTYDDSGPTYADKTSEARDVTNNDVPLLPATPAVNDATYFGSAHKFDTLVFQLGTSGVGTWTITYEYYSQSSSDWVTLTVTDGTSAFTNLSNTSVTFNIPSDWIKNTVNSQEAYWIRARVSAYTSITTQPLAKNVEMYVSLIYISANEGLISGMLSWVAFVINNHASAVIQAKVQFSVNPAGSSPNWKDIDETGFTDVAAGSTLKKFSGTEPVTALRVIAKEKVTATPSDDVDAYLFIQEDY